MTEPFFRTRRAESFSAGQRKLGEAALYVVAIGGLMVGSHLFWNWRIPLDPDWTPPPRGQTIVASGVFASSTDALQPRGYDFVASGGIHMRLRCTPHADASPTTRDNCLAGRGRLADYAGQDVSVRYYELPGAADGEPQRILLSANAGPRWILRSDDQSQRLAADAATQKRNEVGWRARMSFLGGMIVLIIGICVFHVLRRKAPTAPSPLTE